MLIDIHSLTPEQRIELIGELWDSLEPVDSPLTVAQSAELDRRLETADADLGAGVSWQDLRAEIAARSR